MAPPDPTAALVAFIKADSDVKELVSERVFAGELPRTETDEMPRQAVLIQPAGGGVMHGNAYQQYGDQRFDVRCYGTTPLDSWSLYLAVYGALKELRRAVHEEVLLHWARTAAKGATGRDPDTDWPLTISSWQVLVAEVTT